MSSIHAMTVPVFTRMLGNVLSWLDKAEAHAKAKDFELENYVTYRLTADMLDFTSQIQIATDTAKLCVARLTGVEAPKWPDEEKTFPELRQRIQKALDFLKSVPEAKFAGAESREVQLQLGPDRKVKLTGLAMVQGFSLPNFFFHVTMIYALLRQGGVTLGKSDFLGGI
jgi:uncharacterized protein